MLFHRRRRHGRVKLPLLPWPAALASARDCVAAAATREGLAAPAVSGPSVRGSCFGPCGKASQSGVCAEHRVTCGRLPALRCEHRASAPASLSDGLGKGAASRAGGWLEEGRRGRGSITGTGRLMLRYRFPALICELNGGETKRGLEVPAETYGQWQKLACDEYPPVAKCGDGCSGSGHAGSYNGAGCCSDTEPRLWSSASPGDHAYCPRAWLKTAGRTPDGLRLVK